MISVSTNIPLVFMRGNKKCILPWLRRGALLQNSRQELPSNIINFIKVETEQKKTELQFLSIDNPQCQPNNHKNGLITTNVINIILNISWVVSKMQIFFSSIYKNLLSFAYIMVQYMNRFFYQYFLPSESLYSESVVYIESQKTNEERFSYTLRP